MTAAPNTHAQQLGPDLQQSSLTTFAQSATSALMTPAVFSTLARIAECVGLIALGTGIARLYVPTTDFAGNSNYILAPMLTALIATSLFQAFRLYNIPTFNAPHKNAGYLMLGWAIAVIALVGSVFFLKMGPDFSRVWMVLWFLSGLACIATTRLALMLAVRAARRSGYLTRNAIIYGSSASSNAMIAALQSDPHSDIRICGVFDDRATQRAHCAPQTRLTICRCRRDRIRHVFEFSQACQFHRASR